LNNVAKHSTVDEAKVLLEAAEDGLTLVVSDSGVGFDPETTTGNTGLLSMREGCDSRRDVSRSGRSVEPGRK
jgi:signal transduction histidine kinase